MRIAGSLVHVDQCVVVEATFLTGLSLVSGILQLAGSSTAENTVCHLFIIVQSSRSAFASLSFFPPPIITKSDDRRIVPTIQAGHRLSSSTTPGVTVENKPMLKTRHPLTVSQLIRELQMVPASALQAPRSRFQ